MSEPTPPPSDGPLPPAPATPEVAAPKRRSVLLDWLWPACDSVASARRAVWLGVGGAAVLLAYAVGRFQAVAAAGGLSQQMLIANPYAVVDLALSAVAFALLLRRSYAGALLGLFWALFDRAHVYAGLVGGTRPMPTTMADIALGHAVPLLVVLLLLQAVRGTHALRRLAT